MCVFGAICLLVGFVFLYWHMTNGGLESSSECIHHDMENCIDCIKMYGFCIERYMTFDACEEHDDQKPYNCTSDVQICLQCRKIPVRYVI